MADEFDQFERFKEMANRLDDNFFDRETEEATVGMSDLSDMFKKFDLDDLVKPVPKAAATTPAPKLKRKILL